MASLYVRRGSPFWFLRFREGKRWRAASTGFRHDSAEESARARELAAERSLAEARQDSSAARVTAGRGWEWVDGFLVSHCMAPRTLVAYRGAWKHVVHFCTLQGIHSAEDVRFSHGADYVAWRTVAKRSGKSVSRNTALQDLKTWSLVLRHAMRRGEVDRVALEHLGISRIAPVPRAELAEADILRCLAILDSEPEWIRLSFLIALHTGCRLRETRLALRLVDFERGTITFGTPKGGAGRAFTRPLPAALRPTLEPIRDREFTHEFPFQPSRCFQNFFHRAGCKGVSFHGLRVAYITRLARAAVPLSAAMRLVNHSSRVVHAVYQRLGVEDVRAYADVPIFSTRHQSPTCE